MFQDVLGKMVTAMPMVSYGKKMLAVRCVAVSPGRGTARRPSAASLAPTPRRWRDSAAPSARKVSKTRSVTCAHRQVGKSCAYNKTEQSGCRSSFLSQHDC